MLYGCEIWLAHCLFIINRHQYAGLYRAANDGLAGLYFLHPGVKRIAAVSVVGGGNVEAATWRTVGVHHVVYVVGVVN